MNDQGLEDAAILLMSLGEGEAAEVLRHLAPKEVQRLGETIAKLQSVPRERVDGVLDRFGAAVAERNPLVPDSGRYVESVLRRALGDEKAGRLLERIGRKDELAGIENLKWMDPAAVADLLRGEHPQIVAAILVHLDGEHAAAALKRLPEAERNEAMARIATLDGIDSGALRELDDALATLLAVGAPAPKATLGGAKKAAELVNRLGGEVQASVLDYIRETDDELAQQIKEAMFTFDDLEQLDDKGVQALLKEVQTESLVVALKGATPQLRDKVLRNMSTRAAETLREDIDSRGPVRLAEVEAQQKELVKTVLQLAEEGQIVLGGGGDDGYV